MLMIKTSTQITNPLTQEAVGRGESSEDLSEDELAFYDFIKKDLNKLEKPPSSSLVEKLVNYSTTH